MARTVPVYTAPTDRFLTDFWGLFQPLAVNDTQTNILVGTVDKGVGTLQASPLTPPFGGDRRLYLLDQSYSATDAEAHLTYTAFGGCQTGVVLRVKPGGSGHVAPLVWQNVFFGGTGSLLPGAWEFSGTALTNTNQQASPDALIGYPRQVVSATGDGTTATVTLAERHWVTETGGTLLQVNNNALFPGNPFVSVTQVLDPFSFRVAHTTAGTQPGGTVSWAVWPPGVARTLAVRLVGTTITAKQWPTVAPEPAWNDLVKTGSVVLPGTLAGGVSLPSGPGRVGFVAAHLGDTGRLEVQKFEVVQLA